MAESNSAAHADPFQTPPPTATTRWQTAIARIKAEQTVGRALRPEPRGQKQMRYFGNFVTNCVFEYPLAKVSTRIAWQGRQYRGFGQRMKAYGAELFTLYRQQGFFGGVFGGIPWYMLSSGICNFEKEKGDLDGEVQPWPPSAKDLATAALRGALSAPFEMALVRATMGFSPLDCSLRSLFTAWHLDALLCMLSRSTDGLSFAPILVGSIVCSPIHCLLVGLRSAEIERCSTVPVSLPLNTLWGMICGGVQPRGLFGSNPWKALWSSVAQDLCGIPWAIACGLGFVFVQMFLLQPLLGSSPLADQRDAIAIIRPELEARDRGRQPLQEALQRAVEQPVQTEVDLSSATALLRSLSRQISQPFYGQDQQRTISSSGVDATPSLRRTTSMEIGRSVSQGIIQALARARESEPDKSTTAPVHRDARQKQLSEKLSEKHDLLLRAAHSARAVLVKQRGYRVDDLAIGRAQGQHALLGLVGDWTDHVVRLRTEHGICEYPLANVEVIGPLTQPLLVERDRIIRSGLAEVARRHVLELTSPDIQEVPRARIFHGLTVYFVGEQGADLGGVLHDFVESMADAMVKDATGGAVDSVPSRPLANLRATRVGLLCTTSDQTLMPASAKDIIGLHAGNLPASDREREHLTCLTALGRVLALALLNRCPCPVPFSEVVFCCLLGVPFSPDDIRRLDPDLWRHRLQPLLIPGGVSKRQQELTEWCMDPLRFVSVPHKGNNNVGCEPLLPGGEEKLVTDDNKEEYIRLVCDDYLVGGVRVELGCILQGFWEVLPQDLLKSCDIDAEELRMLVSGVDDIDVDEWEKHTNHEGHQSAEVASWFFEWLRTCDAEQRGRILAFVTGSSRLPVGGWDAMKDPTGHRIQFKISVEGDKGALPSAHTCFNTLVLPPVDGFEVLRAKMESILKYAGREMMIV